MPGNLPELVFDLLAWHVQLADLLTCLHDSCSWLICLICSIYLVRCLMHTCSAAIVGRARKQP